MVIARLDRPAYGCPRSHRRRRARRTPRCAAPSRRTSPPPGAAWCSA